MFLHCYEHIAYNLKRQNGGKKVTIELENLGRKFQSGLLETTALHEVSLHINQGEFLAIMGHLDAANQPYCLFWGCLINQLLGGYASLAIISLNTMKGS